MDDRLFFICECNSMEHIYAFWYDEELNQIYFEPYLHTERNFFGRLLYGLKYIFGHKSNYGAFDEIIIKPKDLEKIYELVKK